MATTRPNESDPVMASALAKVARRTVPILAVLYIVSFLDRVNIGFAALTMNQQLGISSSQYGLAAGIFFLGYLIFQVPSNLLLVKFGARRWLAVIVLTWGLISTCMAAVRGIEGLVVARFLLGMAEAGFFPGCILYLTHWFPKHYQGRVVAGFMFGIPIANILGAPVSGMILNSLDGWHGLANWQWLFILESLPAILGAGVVLKFLPDNPHQANWLTAEERDKLAGMSTRPGPVAGARSGAKPASIVATVVLLAVSYFGLQVGMYGIGLWLPQIVANSGASALMTGVISAVPYLFAILAMYAWGRYVDTRGASGLNVFIPALVAAISLAISAYMQSFAAEMVFLTLLTMGVLAAMPAFWANASRVLPTASAAIGIAVINSTGNLGGFIGPFTIGWVKEHTQSFQVGLLCVAAITAIGSLAALVARPPASAAD